MRSVCSPFSPFLAVSERFCRAPQAAEISPETVDNYVRDHESTTDDVENGHAELWIYNLTRSASAAQKRSETLGNKPLPPPPPLRCPAPPC